MALQPCRNQGWASAVRRGIALAADPWELACCLFTGEAESSAAADCVVQVRAKTFVAVGHETANKGDAKGNKLRRDTMDANLLANMELGVHADAAAGRRTTDGVRAPSPLLLQHAWHCLPHLGCPHAFTLMLEDAQCIEPMLVRHSLPDVDKAAARDRFNQGICWSRP